MKINHTVTADMSKEEIDIFMRALCRAKGISTWSENVKEYLPESAKIMSEEADKVAYAIENFLEWMSIEIEDYIYQYEELDFKEFGEKEN